MTVLRPTSDAPGQRLLRAGVLVLVCVLGGAYDVLNNSFALMVARAASFPEEEEHASKDRAALTAAQPSRKGTIRPHGPAVDRVAACPATPSASSPILPTFSAHRTLTGAGIFQHC